MNKTARHTLLACVAAALLAPPAAARAAEFHVAPSGNDANPGTPAAPLRTIQRAADLAQPGDAITVHEGVYRERITPPRGGESDAKRIVYQAAPGEKVEIKGSEVVKNWVKVQDDVWKVTLPNSFFGGFNPYSDLIHGDWFNPKGREHHTGAVYLNGDWLIEAAKLDDVLKPAGSHAALVRPGGQGQHHDLGAVPRGRPQRATGGDQRAPDRVLPGQAGRELHHRARLHPAPRGHALGAAHRRADRPDRHALEQGLDHREQRRSATRSARASRWANTATSGTTRRPTPPRATSRRSSGPWQNGWNKETIGHHVVRNNTISHCEQAGIVGSLGAVFSVDHRQHHPRHPRPAAVHRRRDGGHQVPRRHRRRDQRQPHLPHLPRTLAGLDGPGHARLAKPVPRQRRRGSVRRGEPRAVLVDNNLFLSAGQPAGHVRGRRLRAQSDDRARSSAGRNSSRETPYHPAHSTAVAGLVNIKGGDNRFYNNIFVGRGESAAAQAGRRRHRGGRRLRALGVRRPGVPACTPAATCITTARGPTPRRPSRSCEAEVDPKVKLVEEDGGCPSPPDPRPGRAEGEDHARDHRTAGQGQDSRAALRESRRLAA